MMHVLRTMTLQMKLCDFCQHEPTPAIMHWPRGSTDVVWTVKCTHCGANGPMHRIMEQAIEMWNRGEWVFDGDWDHVFHCDQ